LLLFATNSNATSCGEASPAVTLRVFHCCSVRQPRSPFTTKPALAQLSDLGQLPPDAVKLNANENPMGPCPEAAEAIHRVVQQCGRYMYDEGAKMAQTLAEQMG